MATRDQLRLSVSGRLGRSLFGEHFLTEIAPDWPEIAQLAPASLLAELRELWERERETLAGANEAQTEESFIRPVLRTLGFAFSVQGSMSLAGSQFAPDYGLFASDAARADAERRGGAALYDSALGILEAKRFDRPLDRRRVSGGRSEDPVAQTIQYLTITRTRWAMLTNGRLWRLYAAEGDLVEGACHEMDLIALLEDADEQAFRLFLALFRREAFETGIDGRSLLDRALDESRAREVEVGEAIERQILSALPRVARGLLGDDEPTEQALRDAFDNGLVFLYRLLFCLHAEDRGLLPVEDRHFRRYSLRDQRWRLAEVIDDGRVFSTRSDDLFNDLRALFAIVDRGDPDLGVNAYDGGLFDAERHPWLQGRSVPDADLAPALDAMYRVAGRQVDYADLAVRHLGTIYEQLLAFRLVVRDGGLELAPADERHDSGSYFTPEFIVDEIVRRTLAPILARTSREVDSAGLRGEAALSRFLELRVVDPAMGSGHFLVSATAVIANHIAVDPSYDGERSFDELARLVAERCIYGVDLNPMAVELARVALWLTTVRGDRPLAFLGNLRAGNSLVGASVAELLTGGETLFSRRLADEAQAMIEASARIHAIGDVADVDAAHEKQRVAAAASALRAPLEVFADETLATCFNDADQRPFFHWELEFPEVFLGADGLPREDRGFDAVLGNPPYIRIQMLGRGLAQYCRRVYATASGSFDAYVPFIERSIDLLSPSGRLGFIVPSKWLKLDYGRRLREQLASQGFVSEIVDFGDAQLFPGATNYTCILVLDRAGQEELRYARVSGSASAVRRTLTEGADDGERHALDGLGGAPWLLASGEEARLLRALSDGAEPLHTVTERIFQGLITSADPVYIVRNLGFVGGLRRVYSKASDRVLELEPDLLHPLASGADVERYAFEPLEQLLLFPYRRHGEEMRLVTVDELDALPMTRAYLVEHEGLLRGRERGKMDHERWWAYVYPKSLAAHDRPKLGVAATVKHLEVAADLGGEIYFHNVRVNGILPSDGGPDLQTLVLLLGSRAIDYAFRRSASPLANGFYTANRQFIADLPIRVDVPPGLSELGGRLVSTAATLSAERGGFTRWLEDSIGSAVAALRGVTAIRGFGTRPFDELLAAVQSNSATLPVDVRARSFVDALRREHREASARLGALRAALVELEREADAAVYDLYELTAADRALIDAEYA